jgi:hypothetical protein
MAKKYPYQNHDLDDLPGEQWTDIPWLDGYARISTLGRLKRLDMEIQTSNSIRRYCAKIAKLDLRAIKNKSINEDVYGLFGQIIMDGVRYRLAIARLVYCCFVESFDYWDFSLLVTTKDGDGRNIKPGNLRLINHSQRSIRMFERNRHRMKLVTSYLEFTKQGLTTSSNAHCRQISQYTAAGKKIKTFPSAAAAALVLGIPSVGINSVLKGRQILTHGFGWAYGNAPRLDIAGLREKTKLSYIEKKGQPVTQYDRIGKRIATYPAVNVAARATGISGADISTVISGRRRSAGGFIWKKGKGKVRIDVSNYPIGEPWRAKRLQKKVHQYNLDGKYIRTFESVKSAAERCRISASTISGAIKENTTAAGYKWRFIKLY